MGPTIDELVNAFLAEQRGLHVITELTARNYRPPLRLVGKVLDGRPVSTLADADVRAWLARQRKLSDATRRSRYSMLRQFCRWLVRHGHLVSDPTVDVRPPRIPRSVPRALTKQDVRRLLLACPDARARAIVVLMLELGLRCVEVSNLQIGDWDPRAQTLRVVGKGRHERILPMTRAAAGGLRVYLSGWPVTLGPIFRSKRNHVRRLEPDSISRLVAQWMETAGIKSTTRDGVSAHALRHTAASDVLEQCGDLRVVQEMLGHVHLATTSIYLRRAGVAKLRDAMEDRGYDRVGSQRGDTFAPDEIETRAGRLSADLRAAVDHVAELVEDVRVLVIAAGPGRERLSDRDFEAWLKTPVGGAYDAANQLTYRFEHLSEVDYWREPSARAPTPQVVT